MAYLWLDELELGSESALSMIWLRMINHKTVEKKSFAAYMSMRDPEVVPKLRNLIELSNMLRAANKPNITSCRDQWGKLCWFKANGQCQGV
jgi:hypothetical protein